MYISFVQSQAFIFLPRTHTRLHTTFFPPFTISTGGIFIRHFYLRWSFFSVATFAMRQSVHRFLDLYKHTYLWVWENDEISVKSNFPVQKKKSSPTPYTLILFVYVQTTTETIFNVPVKKKGQQHECERGWEVIATRAEKKTESKRKMLLWTIHSFASFFFQSWNTQK